MIEPLAGSGAKTEVAFAFSSAPITPPQFEHFSSTFPTQTPERRT
jgi:hypothetical protein